MGIAGFGRAAELRRIELPSAMLHMERLRNEFEKRVLSSTQGAVVNAADASRLCNTTSIRFDGVDGEALVAQLDRNGVICSQTSACIGGQLRPSHTLRALGLSDDQARSSVRFGLSIFTTQEEVERAAAVVTEICRRIGTAAT